MSDKEDTDKPAKITSKKFIKRELPQTFAGFIVAAFTLVAGLAWNDAIKELFSTIFSESGNLISLFTYAIAVTLIAVLIARQMGRKIKK